MHVCRSATITAIIFLPHFLLILPSLWVEIVRSGEHSCISVGGVGNVGHLCSLRDAVASYCTCLDKHGHNIINMP